MDFIPEKSCLQLDKIDTRNKDNKELINYLGIRKLIPGLQKDSKKNRDKENECLLVIKHFKPKYISFMCL